MSLPAALRCPFCRTVLAPHVSACHRCHAQRQARPAGMSPRRFGAFVACWLALALPLMAAALVVGLVPWRPGGQPPSYALALIGAKASADERVRCRLEVVQPDGRVRTEWVDGACSGPTAPASAAAAALSGTAPTLTQRRIATALHSAIAIGLGAAAGLGLLPLLRRAFLRKAAPRWVRRAAA